MDSQHQSAAFIISAVLTPLAFAAEVVAVLLKCALKMFVSMPALNRISFSHLEMVAAVTCLVRSLHCYKQGLFLVQLGTVLL